MGTLVLPQELCHQAEFFTQARDQLRLFPRIKGLIYFETPSNAKGMDSRVDRTQDGLRAFRKLGRDPSFDVRLPHNYGPGGRGQ
jgi:hypothetical protein